MNWWNKKRQEDEDEDAIDNILDYIEYIMKYSWNNLKSIFSMSNVRRSRLATQNFVEDTIDYVNEKSSNLMRLLLLQSDNSTLASDSIWNRTPQVEIQEQT